MMMGAFFEAVVCVICGLLASLNTLVFFRVRVPVARVCACVRACLCFNEHQNYKRIKSILLKSHD